ncbi:response regulator [Lacipirellula sp.]|uniref:response regulator n=1 Tax=Lacipirellula sp. TaxID=2691419 RepID=UPI003D0A963C
MKTVLLIEDNDDNTLLIEDIFAFEGVAAQLVSFPSAEEALEFAAHSPPDLILMDIGLPGMCGLEATRRLRAHPATCNTPIWAVTARAMKEDEEAARRAGCDFYITKPFDQEDLGYMVKFVVASTISDNHVSPPQIVPPHFSQDRREASNDGDNAGRRPR